VLGSTKNFPSFDLRVVLNGNIFTIRSLKDGQQKALVVSIFLFFLNFRLTQIHPLTFSRCQVGILGADLFCDEKMANKRLWLE